MENGGGEREKAGDGGRSPAIGGVRPSGAAAAAAPGRHVMRWESFLPRRSLRVLLVEGDDSTRHIVTALLRKCNYRVAGVADGMKAWEVMKERRYSFDLVLTEVAMPLLSGIGLLTNIMGAQECKNIPVIMMSTHDSVNVVLKCMLKGAVDFLVKPVRKNELRNLWQHVWRRRCSNRYSIASDNNTASNQISANIGGRSKTGEASDEGSNAQTSDSKRDIEIESGQKHEELHHVEERRTSEGEADPDSVKDTVIRASMSKMDDVWNTNMIVGVRVDVSLPIQEVSGAKVTQEQDRPCNISSDRKALELVRCTEGNKDDPKPCQNNDPNESLQNMIVFVEPVSNGQCSYAVLKKDALVKDGLRETEKNSFANDTSNVGTSPLWELSLTRPRSNGCIQAELKQKHVLKHSVSSAFSRYGEKRVHSFQKSVSSDLCTRTREGVEECHSLVSIHGIDNDKGSPFSCKEKTLSSPQGNEGETTVYFQASSTNMEKVGLSSQPIENGRPVHSITVEDTTLHRPQHGFIPVPIPVGTIPYQSSCAGYGGILQPVFYPETSFAPQVSDAVEEPASRVPSEHPVLHSHHLIDRSSSLDFYHHEVGDHSHHWRPTIDISEPGESRELCRHLDKAYHYGSCIQDVLKGSGSNGSGETADGAGNTGNALESGNESGVQNGNRKILDCDRSRREAALIKFRLKRKDRCFEKKVRYHGRKKLAEQRPRIKGQFVRQKFQSPQQQEKGRIGC